VAWKMKATMVNMNSTGRNGNTLPEIIAVMIA
jgi:hypothetical protein